MPSWKKVIVSGSDASLNSLNVINGITGSLLGTSSYASNADLLDGLNSTAFVLNTQTSSFVQNSQTSSFATFTALNAYTSSINSYTSSLNSKTSSFATTGSNTFIGNQTISGSVNISQSLNTPLINITSGSLNEGIIDINNSINSWIYSGKSFSITSQETAPVGIFFKSDGTKMYINGSSGDDINEYNLGTAWDVTTAVFSSSFSTSGQDTAPADLFFSSDGTRLYVAGDTNNTIFQYSLGTAWDISTTSYSSISFSVAAKDTNPSGIFFKSDGTKMYVCGTSSDSVHEYDLGTAWNVSTATFLQSFSLSSQDTVPASINFNNDGTKFYIVGSTNDNIYEYNLGTPWNISTAVYYGRTYVGNQEATPTGLYVTTDNVYVVGSTSDTVFQYYSNTNALRLTSDSLILNTELVTTTGSISIDQNLDIGGNAKIVGTVTAGTFSGAGSFSSIRGRSHHIRINQNY
jgi:sugar lactone lactonase YvrE